MRGLLIDPYRREVREVHADFQDYRVIKQFLGDGELGKRSAPLCAGPRLAHDVHSYVDDEGYHEIPLQLKN